MAARDGRLAQVASRHGIGLVVVFGSALDEGRRPLALDLAVGHDGDLDVLALMEDLYRLTGYEAVDVLDLARAGIVGRGEALGYGTPLFERDAGAFAEQQAVALAMLWDTHWLRDLELELLAR
ncbi:MAG: nucleotidyltransferase domain-containing protein [Actinomycetota bacterium]|nr:nucleotidyltransferase domain-containing protein [Actinomycetota bacterium]